ncbi:MAG: discoidin domain-containing protein [Phycisphaeraceae bacterium]|nr:discoidin domain-containing protein [Phycisphaeraceae bacterium]
MSKKLVALMTYLFILSLAPVVWGQTVVEVRVSGGNDDVEEDVGGGGMYTTSSDLEIFSDGAVQVIGYIFRGVDVPQGSAISDAYIEFTCDETKGGTLPVNAIITGQLDAYPADFSANSYDVSSRARTAAMAAWSAPTWNAADDVIQTSNIGPVIEEIVGLNSWVPGNSLVIILEDDPTNPSTGIRCAEAYEGEQDSAALLHLVWEEATKATGPSPAVDERDVLRDTVLTWAPALNQDTLYLGTSFEAVDAATASSHDGVSLFPNLKDGTLDPGRLEFDTPYFWRIDGTSPETGTVKGNLWNFTVESYSYRVQAMDIEVTASSQANDDSTPAKTIDGSGLVDGLHSMTDLDMWLSATAAAGDTFIQYDFRRPQLLEKMVIWNYNASSEPFVGWGLKDVVVEYSMDGATWMPIEQITTLTQAPGLPGYAAVDSFEFSPAIAATSVRILPQSNHGGILPQFGFSEVQFYAFPTYAVDLKPADGTTVDLGSVDSFAWRPGRHVGTHVVMQSADPDMLVEVVTGSVAQYDVLSSDVALGETYYWRVDEVNDNETPSVYVGDVQNFSVLPYQVVEDFEIYGNASPMRPFQTWLDSFGFTSDDYYPDGYGGNGTGSGVGHDIWSLASPHYQGTLMERSIVVPGSVQSLPFYFTGMSETSRSFAQAQDWTRFGITNLTLWFHGDTANTASQMYVKINNTKIPYDGSASDLQMAGWQPWSIDLTSVSGNLQAVTSLTLGVEGSGASGVLYFDDIRLTTAPVVPVTEWRVSASSDDAEEHALDGTQEGLGSSDLELGYEGGSTLQTIGCRWTGIAIPKGATITEAWVQFSADDVDNDYHAADVSLVITGQMPSSEPATFTVNLNDMSDRPATTASVVWDVGQWMETHAMGPDERTPDITSIIQEIVNHDGWGGTVVLMFADNPASPSTGTREAESFDGTASEAPLLHISYQ